MSFKKAIDRQNKIHDRLKREIDEGLKAEADYQEWYFDNPPTLLATDAHYTDAAQLQQWRDSIATRSVLK